MVFLEDTPPSPLHSPASAGLFFCPGLGGPRVKGRKLPSRPREVADGGHAMAKAPTGFKTRLDPQDEFTHDPGDVKN
ncbi:MAG: hypothetical protein Q7U11_04190, partial [Phenylobacterium sp.]|nr:hypothetical protein [Phenylobacterium sp.]